MIVDIFNEDDPWGEELPAGKTEWHITHSSIDFGYTKYLIERVIDIIDNELTMVKYENRRHI